MLALLLCLGLHTPAPGAAQADAPRREPGPLEPGSTAPGVFSWSAACGLTFSWTAPAGYDGGARDLVLILPPNGVDHRWGPAHHPADVFRPRDLVVCMDGTSGQADGGRAFLGKASELESLQSLVAELRSSFAVRRLFLYGYEQGGAFALLYAGLHPGDVDGLVLHASTLFEQARPSRELGAVPIAIVHGTQDRTVPFHDAQLLRRVLESTGLRSVHLRRLDPFPHDVNAARVDEALTWCRGARSDDPAEVLECLRELLRPRPPDSYGFEAPPDFSGAWNLLERFRGRGPRALASDDAALRDEVQGWRRALQSHAEDQVAALEKKLPRKELRWNRRPWLGHLVSLREDYRGLPAVEALARERGYDALRLQQEPEARAIFRAWEDSRTPEPLVAALAAHLGGAFLVEGLPPELFERAESWLALEPELAPEVRRGLEDLSAWRAGWEGGREEYQRQWRRWKGEPQRH